jgi:hypothetical protein
MHGTERSVLLRTTLTIITYTGRTTENAGNPGKTHASLYQSSHPGYQLEAHSES